MSDLSTQISNTVAVPAAAPEPSSALLLGCGVLALSITRRRCRKA